MIYTRTGDAGTTSLVGGTRVDKDDPRVEAYGTVDELNSHVGLLAEMILSIPSASHLAPQLKTVQRNLFTIQTLLATEDTGALADSLRKSLPHLNASDVEELEHGIDAITAQLPKLKSFVIAGGNMAGAEAHVCRTVCRRAERRVVALSHMVSVDATIMHYLNRLSDYLFVLSRLAVVADGKPEDLYIN